MREYEADSNIGDSGIGLRFQQAQEYISAIPKFIKKNTMRDTKAFYEKLGRPGVGAKVIHVAGTNGKGSVCAYLQSVLMKGSYRVGMFTSPHLVTIRERIRIDQELISEEDFVRVFSEVRKECLRRGCAAGQAESAREAATGQTGIAYGGAAGQDYHPSYFEYLYFMAMLYFEEKKPDFIILETGMGGRLDATNSFPSPCICIITEIGLDHMEYLGDTEEKIAAEKAGIVKKAVPFVYFAKNKSVSAVLEKTAENVETKAFPVLPEEISLQNCHEKSIDFSYHSGYYGCSTFHLSGTALYQQENAALCIKTLAVLQERNLVELTEKNLLDGLKDAVWKGRMEEILPGFYLDGAHNVDGIRAFLESVRKQTEAYGVKNRVLLYSSLSDKAYQEVIKEIVSSGLFHEIVLAKINGSRAENPEKLKELFVSERAVSFPDVEEALRYCLKRREEGHTVYAAGSLYLVGEIEKYLKS